MITVVDCTFRINAQDTEYPTYTSIDGTIHNNANDDNIYGVIVNGTSAVTTFVVSASKNWKQGIRVRVTIDGIDVSSALAGAINISHDKNKISTFSLALNDEDYSPLINSHIEISNEVVITAYINGQEKKLFTGIIDSIEVNNTPFSINISGFDFGAKLLEKNMTIISVQDLADSTNRNDIIKYIAQQAGLIDFDIPIMDAVTIDNSFQNQDLWSMIQKEAMIELYWVKFNEDGQMQLKLDQIKTDTSTYPDADWSYGENRFKMLNLNKSKEDIINKITVLGKTENRRVAVTSVNTWTTPYTETWGDGVDISWDETYDKFAIKYTAYGSNNGEFEITPVGNYSINKLSFSIDGALTIYDIFNANYFPYYFIRVSVGRTIMGGVKLACGFTVMAKGADVDTTYETRYDQISVIVTDPNSILKYGEKDGGTIEYPLLETVGQCEAVGSKYIRDSHRSLVNVKFIVPLNPLIDPGETIQFKDSKIGLTTQRYYAESVNHIINPKGGSNTEVGCVYYV